MRRSLHPLIVGAFGLTCLVGAALGDPLQTWTVRTTVVTNLLQDIAEGNGLFVAVGYAGSIVTSPDGVEWTAQTSGTSEHLNTVSFGADLFVAAGNKGTIVVSADGVFWTGVNSATRNPLFGSAFGDGHFVIVGGSNVLVSANGLQWETRRSPVLPRAYLNTATFGDGRFVAIGAGGYAVSSEDTVNWAAGGTNLGNIFALAHANGMYLGVGGGFVGFTEAATSTDGFTWNSIQLFSFSSLVDVQYGNGRFQAIGLSLGFPPPFGPEFLFETADGIDWTLRSLPSPLGIYGLAYSRSRYYGVGAAGLILESGSYIPGCLEALGPPGPNGFEMRITGEIGRPYRVQASTEPSGDNWQDLLLFTNPTEPETLFTDTRASKFPRRYYRVVTP